MKAPQGLFSVLLLTGILALAMCEENKRCRLNDKVRFRSYNFEKIDNDLRVWKNDRFYVSLCEDISKEEVEKMCGKTDRENVFFVFLVDPEYRNCLIFTRDDIYLSHNINFGN